MFKAYQYTPLTLADYEYPDYGQVLWWLICLFPILAIPTVFIFKYIPRRHLGVSLIRVCYFADHLQGRIQDFKLRGAHFKKLRRAEGGTKSFWVFRVKNHDFTPKNHFFSQF